MAHFPLHEFIRVNRTEIIRRCREKAAAPSPPLAEAAEQNRGVPLFLDQLADELRGGSSKTHDIDQSAGEHGHSLLLRGFSVSQVVHEYGAVCQAITDLAVDLNASVSTTDFRTLNRCLDDAIAAAVTEHAREQTVTHEGKSQELRNLVSVAMISFDLIKSGNVGVAGSTGAMLNRTLRALSAVVDRPASAVADRLTPLFSAAPR
jgi:hypothetical protein